MPQPPTHTTPPPSSQAAVYGYKPARGLASQGMAWRYTLIEPGNMAYGGSVSVSWYSGSSKSGYSFPMEKAIGTGARYIAYRQIGEQDEKLGYSYFGARYLDPGLSLWLSVDALSDKYLSSSPYMYVLGNPLILVDPNGDSAFVLINPNGAYGAGYMAMLIQNKDGKWALWSKNGTDESSGSTGANKNDDNGKKYYDSPQAFLDSKDNITNEGKRKYTEGYVVAATKAQDRKMEKGFKNELKKEYNVVTANCAIAVQSALKSAGFASGEYLKYIINNNKGKPWYLRRPITTYDIDIELKPNLIYNRIKKQNPGGATFKPKPPSLKKPYVPKKVKHV